MARSYDVIIIGSGAGGGTLAHALADTGKSILIIERGAMLPIEEDNWSPKAVFVDAKYQARDTWIDTNGRAFNPHTPPPLRGSFGTASPRVHLPPCGGE